MRKRLLPGCPHAQISTRFLSTTKDGPCPAAEPAPVDGDPFAGIAISSKKKARLAGKSLYDENYRQKAAHGLNAAARMLCDDVAKSETKIIGAALKHDAIFLGQLLKKDGRGPADTRLKFAALADWSWLQVSKDSIAEIYTTWSTWDRPWHLFCRFCVDLFNLRLPG